MNDTSPCPCWHLFVHKVDVVGKALSEGVSTATVRGEIGIRVGQEDLLWKIHAIYRKADEAVYQLLESQEEGTPHAE